MGNRKPKVLIVNHCAKRSGAEIALLNTWQSPETVGVHVALTESGPLEADLANANISYEVVPMSQRTNGADRKKVGRRDVVAGAVDVISAARRLRTAAKKYDPDLIISNSMKAHVLLAASLLWLSTPAVMHVRDRITTDFMSRAGVILMNCVLAVVPVGIVANSTSTLESVPRFTRSRSKVVMPSPVRDPGFTINHRSKSQLTFAVVGRITEWKGQSVAVRAFAEYRRTHFGKLLIIGAPLFGETKYLDDIVALASELGVADDVIFMGHQNDVYGALRDVDILLHSSIIPEPFGQVVVQGMALGIPVVAARAGGPVEIIDDQTTGFLYSPGSTTELSRLMTVLADDFATREKVGRAARRDSQRYMVENVRAEYESYVSELLRKVN